MKDEDIKIGQHCWAISLGELLVVLKIGEQIYQVCGAWECGIGAQDLQIISVIERPAGYEKTKLYYME